MERDGVCERGEMEEGISFGRKRRLTRCFSSRIALINFSFTSTNVRARANRFQQADEGLIINIITVFHTFDEIAYNLIQSRLWITEFVENVDFYAKVANHK
jgi:hypothetical protein